jgi:N-methylhydantoinase A
LRLDLEEAAAGMYNVINVNMAAAVREVSIKQGYDPRDFPLVVAGGAGPNHACMFALELEIPVMIIPRESSIFCAAGMLMSDLKHDFVKTYPALLQDVGSGTLKNFFSEMKMAGSKLLQSEGIPDDRIEYNSTLDLRYVKQYHEVNVGVSEAELENADFESIADRFHQQHHNLYGYSLKDEETPVELINLRLLCIGKTIKPEFQREEYDGIDPSKAFKNNRKAFMPMMKQFQEIEVFDGLKLKFGNKITGPAIIEQLNTTTFVTPEYNLMVDQYGSYTMYLKDREAEIQKRILALG